MTDIVILDGARTAIGGFGGSLRDVPVQELAATVIRALLERTGLPPESVEDVLLGHCYPTMEAPAIGRVAALDAGLPVTASGLQIDRRCGSGLQAVVNAVWAAGAEGVAVMDQRLIATSAVRCVGNTLLLQGRTYSPPFVISAVVDAAAARDELAASPQIAVFKQVVEAYGLTYEVRERPEVELPAYDGPLALQHATVG